jgi:Zn-dependent M28 family amino/carboxypeptidase
MLAAGHAARYGALVKSLFVALFCASFLPADDFSQERAMIHIRVLGGLKDRSAGTPGESEGFRYVENALRESGLQVRMESFTFFKEADKIVSANVVATTRDGKADREVILSAHVDSAGTPGAQDNASGVAVLLELARTLPKLDLPFRLRFVFFGAEELGLLGSRAYVRLHREDLRNCLFLFNLDSIGGKEIWIDMRDGVRNVSAPADGVRALGESPDRLARGIDGRWALSPKPPHNDASNVPRWLATAMLDSIKELGYQVNQGRDASSDHRTFTDAGIVATDIAIAGIETHVPEDTPDKIDPGSLEKAARIVTGTLLRVRPNGN